jgi:predicted site-specific integrase-resolvase
MEEDKVMRAEDVMKELNVSRATLSRLVKSGVINPIEKKNPLLKRPKAFTFLSSA